MCTDDVINFHIFDHGIFFPVFFYIIPTVAVFMNIQQNTYQDAAETSKRNIHSEKSIHLIIFLVYKRHEFRSRCKYKTADCNISQMLSWKKAYDQKQKSNKYTRNT